MTRTEALQRLHESRVGHLATVRPDGSPHVIPVTFAMKADRIVTVVDHKPKKTQQLQRLVNAKDNGLAEFVVDHYEDDRWRNLWWVRVGGPAEVHSGGDQWIDAVQTLVQKYPQYRERPPTGPVISVLMKNLSYWSSTP